MLPDRPNVLGCFPGDQAGKPKLLLCPHTDTVSVRGMTIDPFAAELRDGRVYGRGACDTKGTVAAMIWALWELRETLPRLAHEIWFAGLVGEEAGNEGAAALAGEFRGRGFRAGRRTDGMPDRSHDQRCHLAEADRPWPRGTRCFAGAWRERRLQNGRCPALHP